jgi:hypothetical protein
MGSKRGFPSMLVGYAIAALARAYLTGTSPNHVRNTLFNSKPFFVASLCDCPYIHFRNIDRISDHRNAYVASTPKAPLGYLLAFWSNILPLLLDIRTLTIGCKA